MNKLLEANGLKPFESIDEQNFGEEQPEPTTVSALVTIASTTNIVLSQSKKELEDDSDLHYILIPLLVLIGILGLTAMIFLMMRNRRHLNIYCKRRHLPDTFDEDSESGLEPNDYEDLDDPSECLLKSKLHIDNRRDDYSTTQNTQPVATERAIHA